MSAYVLKGFLRSFIYFNFNFPKHTLIFPQFNSYIHEEDKHKNY
jgi:hypothetical protein